MFELLRKHKMCCHFNIAYRPVAATSL